MASAAGVPTAGLGAPVSISKKLDFEAGAAVGVHTAGAVSSSLHSQAADLSKKKHRNLF